MQFVLLPCYLRTYSYVYYTVLNCLHILFASSCVKTLHLPDAEEDSNDKDESDINIVDKKGCTAFHLACLNGHFSVVDYLCSCGANLEAWYIYNYV